MWLRMLPDVVGMPPDVVETVLSECSLILGEQDVVEDVTGCG